MEWVRGEIVGQGSFGTVNLAKPKSQSPRIPPLMAVKSCGASLSASLLNEKSILEELKDCPQIIRCFGGDFSFENGEKLYNVLLEYASGGNLADKIRNSGEFRLPEFDLRRYTKSILRGLHYIHKLGYVHCDLKLQNILLCSSNVAKIADFGLAKRTGEKREKKGIELRGTLLYMSPEMVVAGEQDSPADIWALGCIVAEMVTGAPVWRMSAEPDVCGLLMRIGVGDEVPEIPGELSGNGRDFLERCFVKDPRKRWTAEMLLNHPFVADLGDDQDFAVPLNDTCEVCETSPRGPFDFPDWEYSVESDTWSQVDFSLVGECEQSLTTSPAERVRGLGMEQRPDWSVCDSWITVRQLKK